MLSIVKTMSLIGIRGYLINVEIDVTGGLPNFDIVGLPDVSVKEAKERIRSAIRNSNIDFPSRRILVNLSPADIRKEGTSYDLPMAVGILITFGQIKEQNIKDVIFIGELSLDGRINKVNGILPMCIEALKLGIKVVVLPEQNAKEASILKDLEVIGVKNLQEVVDYLNGKLKVRSTKQDVKNVFARREKYELDFSDVKGQEDIKRALEITAAGGHNCILIGSPGSRKDNDGKKITIYFARFNIRGGFRNY